MQCSCALSDPRSPSPLLAFSFSFKHLPPQLPSPSRWSDQMRRRRRCCKQLLSFFLSRSSSDAIFLSYSIHLIIYEVKQNPLSGEMAIEDICRLLYVLCKKTIQKSRVGNGDIWPKNGRIRSKASGEFQPITEAPVELSGMDGRFFALVLNWLPFMIVVRARKKRNGESWGRSNKQRSSSSSLSSTDRPTSFWHQVEDRGNREGGGSFRTHCVDSAPPPPPPSSNRPLYSRRRRCCLDSVLIRVLPFPSPPFPPARRPR